MSDVLWGGGRQVFPMSDIKGPGMVFLCLMSGGGGKVSEVQCIIGKYHMGTLCVNRQTDMSENITFLQLHWQGVKMKVQERYIYIFPLNVCK